MAIRFSSVNNPAGQDDPRRGREGNGAGRVIDGGSLTALREVHDAEERCLRPLGDGREGYQKTADVGIPMRVGRAEICGDRIDDDQPGVARADRTLERGGVGELHGALALPEVQHREMMMRATSAPSASRRGRIVSARPSSALSRITSPGETAGAPSGITRPADTRAAAKSPLCCNTAYAPNLVQDRSGWNGVELVKTYSRSVPP